MEKTIKSILILSVSLWILDILFLGIYFANLLSIVITAIVLSLLNCAVVPTLNFLSVPETVLSHGLASLLINAIVLNLAFYLVPGSYISSYFEAILASIILTYVYHFILTISKDKKFFK